jgi:hypothetical protein
MTLVFGLGLARPQQRHITCNGEPDEKKAKGMLKSKHGKTSEAQKNRPPHKAQAAQGAGSLHLFFDGALS